MSIAIAVSAVWTVCCWFTELRATPFLGFPPLSWPPLIPFLITLALLLFAIIRWGKRGGFTKIGAWLAVAWKPGNGAIPLAGIVILHLLIQLPFILLPRGANDWDSSLWGLAGYHIAAGEARPVFGYGWDHGVGETQHYNGTLVPHLSAALQLLFGENPYYLRTLNAIIWCLFIIALYQLLRRCFDNATALTAAALAAMPPVSVFVLTHYSEYPQLALFGIVSLWFVRKLSESDQPNWRDFFWWGIVCGVGFYAIPHMLIFIAAGVIVLLMRRPKQFLSPGIAALPAGLLLGALPYLIDFWYSGSPVLISVLRVGNAGYPFERVISGIGETVRLLPWYLGGTYAISPTAGDEIVTPFVIYPLAALILFLFIYVNRTALAGSLKRGPAGAEMFLILAILAVFVFAVSPFSSAPAPYRYLFPLWIAIVVFLAQPLVALLAKHKVWVAVPVTFICVFTISGILYFDLVQSVRRESILANIETWLQAEGVERFYGSFALVYPISYASEERLIGSAAWHWRYEAVPKYREMIRKKPFDTWFYLPQEEGAAREFIRSLRARGSRYNALRSEIGFLITGVDPPPVPASISR